MTGDFVYTNPGKYVAICNRSDFRGHYVKVFDFPQKDDKMYKRDGTKVMCVERPGMSVTASWYFLNLVDFEACLEDVYPVEIFEPVVRVANQCLV